MAAGEGGHGSMSGRRGGSCMTSGGGSNFPAGEPEAVSSELTRTKLPPGSIRNVAMADCSSTRKSTEAGGIDPLVCANCLPSCSKINGADTPTAMAPTPPPIWLAWPSAIANPAPSPSLRTALHVSAVNVISPGTRQGTLLHLFSAPRISIASTATPPKAPHSANAQSGYGDTCLAWQRWRAVATRIALAAQRCGLTERGLAP